ncbi:MAG TPA: c-type cytochrome [Beijerinckiaceae bacterium]|nr:c-type cytochrome [Beijerinckiaceae bacterium]
MTRTLPILAVLLLCAAPAFAQTTKGQIEAGRSLAREHCAACHAIGKADRSKRRGAPAFRTIGRTYDVDNLQEALAEGISVGHKGVDMPEFQFSPDRVDALIAYFRSLRR